MASYSVLISLSFNSTDPSSFSLCTMQSEKARAAIESQVLDARCPISHREFDTSSIIADGTDRFRGFAFSQAVVAMPNLSSSIEQAIAVPRRQDKRLKRDRGSLLLLLFLLPQRAGHGQMICTSMVASHALRLVEKSEPFCSQIEINTLLHSSPVFAVYIITEFD